jgi:hypothetical protein
MGQVLAMKSFMIGISMMFFCGHSLEAGERYVLKEAGPWEDSLSSFSF